MQVCISICTDIILYQFADEIQNVQKNLLYSTYPSLNLYTKNNTFLN